MISESLSRRLTLVNSLVLILILLGLLSVGIIFREPAANIIYGYFEKEFVSSEFIESFLSSPESDEEGIVSSRLPLYEIKVKASNARKIHVLSQHLVDQGVMLDRDKQWFPAKFSHDGREYKVKIRLRGDFGPHWRHAKKSWRIKFDKDDLFNGYRQLNLVIPNDRYDEGEFVAFNLARKAGLLVPDSGFVQVTMNGVDMGAYFWFENNSAEMLEKARYPEGEIIRSKNVISEKAYFLHGLEASDFYYVQGAYINSIRDDASAGYPMERFWQVLELAEKSDDATFRRRLPYYLDMQKFYKWSAIAWMFGSKHAGGIDNLRWYYDTTTGLLEPILYDVGVSAVEGPVSRHWQNNRFDTYYSPIVRRILSIPEFRLGRNQVLWNMLNDDEFDPVPISEEVYANIKPYLMRGVRGRLGNELEEKHEQRIKLLTHNRGYLKSKLAFAAAYANSRKLLEDGTPVLSVQIVPDTHDSIGLRSIALELPAGAPAGARVAEVTLNQNGERHTLSNVSSRVDGKHLLVEFDDQYFGLERTDDGLELKTTPATLDIRLTGIAPEQWVDTSSLLAVEYDFFNPVNGWPVGPESLNHPPHAQGDAPEVVDAPFVPVEQFIKDSGLPFARVGDALILPRGEYTLSKNLIVPVDYRLVLRPGVQLKIAPDISLLTFRAIDIQGTADSPVTVGQLREGEPWGVFAILNAAEASTVSYLQLGGGSESWVNGAFFSGQLSFYSSDLKMSHSLITNGLADDGLNVKKAHAEVTHTVFEGNSSDAFDADWVNGSVTHSIFRDNGGDGLDTSGARIWVADTLFTGMADKAISAGENSRLVVMNNVMRDSAIGVASKDKSIVRIFASALYGNDSALALYRKKQIFGGGKVEVLGSVFWNNNEIVSMDAESTLVGRGNAIDAGVDVSGLDITDNRQAPLDDYFKVEADGSVSYVGQGDTPFSSGPTNKAQTLMDGVELPNLSQHPIGLLRPLEVTR